MSHHRRYNKIYRQFLQCLLHFNLVYKFFSKNMKKKCKIIQNILILKSQIAIDIANHSVSNGCHFCNVHIKLH